MLKHFAQNCLYCVERYLHEIQSCTSNCLQQSGVQPEFAGGILFLTAGLAAVFFLFSFVFRDDLKKFLGFRLASIGFFSASLFTLGSIFGAPLVLKELAWLVPATGIGSFLISYFFSFYLMKRSYSAKEIKISVKRICRQLKIFTPKIFIFDSAEPKAFSVDGFRKAIFLSNSLLAKLSKKDLSAVLLHELYHLKRRSGAWKNFFSACQNLSFKILPLPIDLLEKREEKEIDKEILRKHGVDVEKIRDKLWK